MDLISEAYQRGRNARRHATAMTILDTAAVLGLFVGALFWNVIFWRLLAPGDLFEVALSVAFAAAYAIVLPMLLSLLAPSTPAGMLLAETRWKTIGHAISLTALLYMGYHAFTVIHAWWASRPAIVETGQVLWMTIGAMIIFIVVPALAWVQVAPDRWVAEIVQAQQVKQLKIAQAANLMLAKEQYARSLAILRRGLSNATVAERAELAGTVVALQRAQNEALEQIADQMRIITGDTTGVRLLDDPHVEQQLQQLADGIQGQALPIRAAPALSYVEPPAWGHPAAAAEAIAPPASAAAMTPREQWPRTELIAHQDAVPAPSPPTSAAAAAASAAASRSEPRRYAAEFRAVAAAHPPPAVFGSRAVADAVGKSERTARDMLSAWLEAGWIGRGDAANSYYITSEA